MAIEHNRVTWDTGNNTDSVAAASNVTSDTYTPDANCIGPLQAHIKCDNAGTPAAGDVVTFYILQTGGDTDGTGGSDEFDSANAQAALELVAADTNTVDPFLATVQLPWPFKACQFWVVSAAASNSHTVSIMVTEQKSA